MRAQIGLLLALACASPLLAQPRGNGEPGQLRQEVRLQFFRFGNFFYTPIRGAEEDVNAYGAEYRGAYGVKNRPAEVYGHLSFLHYDNSRLEDSYGGRLGIRYNGKINSLRAYVDRTVNRPSFEVGNIFAPADTTTFQVEHAVRVSRSWELGAEGRHQVQSFESPSRTPLRLSRDNTYTSIAGIVRYRGFGYRYTPGIGFRDGHLNVHNADESYGERSWFVQFETIPVNGLYFSLRYNDRNRDYTIGNPFASNFGREEEHPGIEFVGDYKPAGRLGYTLYYARENVEPQGSSGDFTVSVVLLGVSIGL